MNSNENITANEQKLSQENNQQELDKKAQKAKRNKKILLALFIIIVIILLVAICVEAAYLADFIRFRNTDSDGLLLTRAQRLHE